jgi:hypothetical protein
MPASSRGVSTTRALTSQRRSAASSSDRIASVRKRVRSRAGTLAAILAIVAASFGFVLAPARALAAGTAVIPNSSFAGFTGTSLGPTDDGSSPTAIAFGFNINYFGTEHSSAWVNNNGNLTFGAADSGFTPFGLAGATTAVIAPFFADVDTNVGNVANFGTGTLDGFKIFVVSWPGVECYAATNPNVLDNFQVILIDRADLGTGVHGDDFQIEFNFNSIQWDAGIATGGNSNCTASPANDAAAVGYSDGTQTAGHYYQLPGSQQSGGLLDSNATTGLINNELNSDASSSVPPSGTPVLGRYIFSVEGGIPVAPTTVATSLSGGTSSGTNITVAPNVGVKDTATLSGPNAPIAGGTVTYGVYSNNTCTTLISSAGTMTVSAGVVPNSSAVILAGVGTYYWDAAYSGDVLNDPSDAGCSEIETVAIPPATVSTTVDDASGSTPWNGAEVTGAAARDTASVASTWGFTPTGTVLYSFFTNGTCAGTAASTDTETIAAGATPNSTATAALGAGSYSYHAAYSGDSNNAASTGACEPFTVAKASASPGSIVHDPALGSAWNGNETTGATAIDTASVTGIGGFTPTGTTLYSFFTNGTCAGTASTTHSVTLSGGSVPNSLATGPLPAGSYSYKAAYSGDGNFLAGTPACEPFSVVPVQSGVGTVVDNATTHGTWNGTETIGAIADDTSTVATVAGIIPTGTMTYTLYPNQTCTGTAATTSVKTLAAGAVPNSSTSSGLSAGWFSYLGSYSGDSNYLAAAGSCEPFHVAQSTSSVGTVVDDAATNTPWAGTETTGASADDTATVATVGGFAPAGTVTYALFSNGACSGSPSATETVTLTGGTVPNASPTGALGSGPHAYDASYSGDGNYQANSSACEPFAVLAQPVITSADHVAFAITHAGAFTVTTAGYPGGAAMTINDGGASLPSGVTFVDNSNGTATLAGTPATGTSGTYPFTITATNGVPSPAGQSFTLTIDLAPAITTVNAATFEVGVTGSFTVGSDGFPGAGTMTVSDGAAALPSGVTFVDNGDETATLSGTPAAGTGGIYSFTITAANGVAPNATQLFTLSVDEAPTVTSADSVTFGVGAPSSFTATMAGFPSGGAVTFSDGSAVLPTGVTFVDDGNGTATLAGTPGIGTIGAYPFTIAVANGIAPGGTQLFTLTVAEAATTTVLTSPTNPSLVGQTVTLTATVAVTAPSSGSATGAVEFLDGLTDIVGCTGQLVSAGTATCVTSFTGASTHMLTAVYSGDANFGTSTAASVDQVIDAAETTVTTMSSANPAVTGETVTYTVTLSRTAPATGTPGGTVTFTDGVTPITGCEAVAAVTGVAACTVIEAIGPHSIGATYSGDGDDIAGSAASLNEQVVQDATVTTVTSSPNPSTVGAAVTITVTVEAADPGSGNPTGNIVILADGKAIGTVALDSSVDSRAVFSTARLTVGTHAITATYGGDAYYLASVAAATADSQSVMRSVLVPLTGARETSWAGIAALALLMNGMVLLACTRRRRRLS